ncbi:hypothetical protein C0Q70_03336 [Pomacea canaliculata]|uniref:Uncharacterized protein n=1 Tax=Pomacea canaliculata TaxID=400727 RepID=A0A2T7PSF8_POMCA|nr:hypothetical protein C0Q70_03336 [Pomacea canaliculata]
MENIPDGDSVSNDTSVKGGKETHATNLMLFLVFTLLSGGLIAFFTYKLVSSLRQKQKAKEDKKRQKQQKKEKETHESRKRNDHCTSPPSPNCSSCSENAIRENPGGERTSKMRNTMKWIHGSAMEHRNKYERVELEGQKEEGTTETNSHSHSWCLRLIRPGNSRLGPVQFDTHITNHYPGHNRCTNVPTLLLLLNQLGHEVLCEEHGGPPPPGGAE